MIEKEEKTSYGPEDKNCTHCGGTISGHCCGEVIIYWCDKCGSNNPTNPPNVSLTFTK